MVLGLNLKTIPGFICVHLRSSAAKNAFSFAGLHLRPKDFEPKGQPLPTTRELFLLFN